MGNKTKKIIELYLDDLNAEDSVLDFVSLVSEPAIELPFIAFNKSKKKDYNILPNDVKQSIMDMLDKITDYETRDILEDCTILYEEEVTDIETEMEIIRKYKDKYLKRTVIVAETDEDSIMDFGSFKVRYYYEGPRDSKNRDFCAYLMSRNQLFRWEDISHMSEASANDEFGTYDIFKYKGSYGCRHRWVKVMYREDAEGKKIDPRTPAPSTQAELVNKPTSVVENADLRAKTQEQMGKQEFSYNNYPKKARANAAAAIARNELKPISQRCGTMVGKVRAQQLANGRNVTLETVKRMHSYLSRAEGEFRRARVLQDYDSCAYISYMLWGGPEALVWAKKILRQEGEL